MYVKVINRFKYLTWFIENEQREFSSKALSHLSYSRNGYNDTFWLGAVRDVRAVILVCDIQTKGISNLVYKSKDTFSVR